MVPIHIRDCCACLTVSRHVRQFVVFAEGLAVRGRADAASDVQLLGDDIFPDSITRWAYVMRPNPLHEQLGLAKHLFH